MLAARWSGVELDGPHPTLHVEGTLQRVDGELRVLAPKTARSRRTVPLPATLVAILRGFRTEQLERRMMAGPAWPTPDDFVFDRSDGRPIDPDAYGKAFRTARDVVGLHGVRLHDLRHAFASFLIAEGTNPRLGSDLMGHATIAFTLATYVHPDDDAAAAAAVTTERVLAASLAIARGQIVDKSSPQVG